MKTIPSLHRKLFRAPALAVALMVSAVACSDESGGGASGGGAGAGGTGGSPAGSCPLSADKVLVADSPASAFTKSASHDSGRTVWEAVAQPGVSATVAPGDTVALQLTLDPPLRVTGSIHQLNVTFELDGSSKSARAGADLEPSIVATGTMATGLDVLPRLSADADGVITSVTVGTITLLPEVGETLSCVSIRFEVPDQLYSFDNSSQSVATAASSPITLSAVRVAASEVEEVALDPAPFSLEGE